jgi:SAM-dependent methyltransferase
LSNTESGESTEQRLERERAFHNQIFSSMERKQLSGFYAIAASSEENYCLEISKRFRNADVLEYGCGPHTYATVALKAGAKSVLGIDISDTAIEISRKKCTEAMGAASPLLDRVKFQRMNAEAMDVPDNSFDLVFGTAILHHLDLNRSFAEIRRVLRPGGQAVFLEPLGHNPLINWYRRRTPHLRTPDEHPFVTKDFDLMRTMFTRVDVNYFHLSSLSLVPFSKSEAMVKLAKYFDAIDRGIFRFFPPARKHAWSFVLVVTK